VDQCAANLALSSLWVIIDHVDSLIIPTPEFNDLDAIPAYVAAIRRERLEVLRHSAPDVAGSPTGHAEEAAPVRVEDSELPQFVGKAIESMRRLKEPDAFPGGGETRLVLGRDRAGSNV
jgi:hypothetical protein